MIKYCTSPCVLVRAYTEIGFTIQDNPLQSWVGIRVDITPPTLEDAQAKLCCRTCVNSTKGHKKDSEVSAESKVEFNTYYIVYI